MRAALLTAILALVLAGTALNLVLGAVWVAALVVLLVLGRRARAVAWLVLGLVLLAAVAGVRLHWYAAPPPVSYATDEVTLVMTALPGLDWVASRWQGRQEAPAGPPTALRARLAERRLEELRYTAGNLERRAAAAVAAGREGARLAAGAPAEAAAVEEAVRRLALTLTAPEFRDLDSRRARLEAWFADLETRLAGARSELELGVVARALDPAAMASVSFRALREDLARVDATVAGLVRALTGGGVSVTATSRLEYDEPRGQLVAEDRYLVRAEPPLLIRRVDVGALRQAAVGHAVSQTLTYGIPPAEPRESVGPPEIVLEPGASAVLVVDRRARPEALAPVRAPLRPVAFQRLRVPPAGGPTPELPVTVQAADAGALRAILVGQASPPRVDAVLLPRWAHYYASAPGVLAPSGAGEAWTPAEPERVAAAGFDVELTPPSSLFRNPGFRAVDTYVYRPTLATAVALVGLAALAAILVRRRPRPAVAAAGIKRG